MNWIQRFFHRHKFFVTPERKRLLGNQKWIDVDNVQYDVLGEIDVEKCYVCGAKRLTAYSGGNLVARWVERARDEK